MLASLSRHALSRSVLAGSRRSLASAATVDEIRVNTTFIFAKQKQKITVPGQVGWTLLKTAQHHGLPLDGAVADSPWDYKTFGEGAYSRSDHVIISTDYYDKTGPLSVEEQKILQNDEPYVKPTSRLAACVTLTKDLDGIQVMVPDTNEDLTWYH